MTAVQTIRRLATDIERFSVLLDGAIVEADVTATELAALVGVPRQSIDGWRSGASIPRRENFARLAAALERARELLPARRDIKKQMATPGPRREPPRGSARKKNRAHVAR